MIHSVFALGDTIAREVMVPRTEMVWIEDDKTLQQALVLFLRSGFSRIPVIGESVDDVLGVLYLKDVIRRTRSGDPARRGIAGRRADARGHLRARVQAGRRPAVGDAGGPHPPRRSWSTSTAAPPAWSPSRTSSRRSSARSPTSTTSNARRSSTSPTVRCGSTARLPIEDLGELFDVELPADEVETVGGLLAQTLGRVPIPGAVRRRRRPAPDRRGHHRPAQPDRHGAGAPGRDRSPDAPRHPRSRGKTARRCLSRPPPEPPYRPLTADPQRRGRQARHAGPRRPGPDRCGRGRGGARPGRPHLRRGQRRRCPRCR